MGTSGPVFAAAYRGMPFQFVRLAGAAIILLQPASSIRAQQANTFNFSASTATSVALGTAADYQVRHSHHWQDYENVMILATLNGAAKQAATTGRPRFESLG